jgi:type IV pilus assembly protein PilB
MPEDISIPLLALIKEQGLIDDLQYEEVAAEYKRTGTDVFHILQNFGIMDGDAILQTMANYLGAPVVPLQGKDFSPQLIKMISAATARMYRCFPVQLNDGVLQVAFEDVLNPARIDEVGFIVKKEIQPVVANPAEISKLIEKHYGAEDNESVSDILKQLGEDSAITREAEELAATDNPALIANLADAAPIVRFVNLIIMQAVQDRASDIHFEPFESEFRIRYRSESRVRNPFRPF